MVKLVCESLEDFKRGVDPRTGLDIGAESSYFWPKTYEELTDEQKKEAYSKNQFHPQMDAELITDDDYLLEPPDAEMRAMFSDYSEWAPLIINDDHTKIYYDINRKGSLNIREAAKISDDDKFHEWLGIPKSFSDNVYSTIDKYTIDFEENDYDIDFTPEQLEILEKAQEKWETHLNNVLDSIRKQHDYYLSEEYFKEIAKEDEWEFDKNLKVVA